MPDYTAGFSMLSRRRISPTFVTISSSRKRCRPASPDETCNGGGFIYSPLNMSSSEIRVLRIHPDLYQGLIQCTLTHCPLEERHTALSYTWGNTDPDHSIWLNGQIFQVRYNLWQFLNLARSLHSLELWIDAICIDQTNILERNHQVRLMGKIYSNANAVLIWLGQGHSKIQSLVNCMASGLSCLSEAHVTPVISNTDDVDSKASKCWDGVNLATAALCKLDYWNRIWVVQEVILAKVVNILYGRVQIQLHLFHNFFEPDNRQNLTSNPQRITAAGIYWNSRAYHLLCRRPECARFRSENMQHASLKTLLETFGHLACTDQRDHVFALLSMATDGAMFIIDYRESSERLILRTICFCAQHIDNIVHLLDLSRCLRIVFRLPKTMFFRSEVEIIELSRGSEPLVFRFWCVETYETCEQLMNLRSRIHLEAYDLGTSQWFELRNTNSKQKIALQLTLWQDDNKYLILAPDEHLCRTSLFLLCRVPHASPSRLNFLAFVRHGHPRGALFQNEIEFKDTWGLRAIHTSASTSTLVFASSSTVPLHLYDPGSVLREASIPFKRSGRDTQCIESSTEVCLTLDTACILSFLVMTRLDPGDGAKKKKRWTWCVHEEQEEDHEEWQEEIRKRASKTPSAPSDRVQTQLEARLKFLQSREQRLQRSVGPITLSQPDRLVSANVRDHSDGVCSFAYSPDGRRVTLSLHEKTIRG